MKELPNPAERETNGTPGCVRARNSLPQEIIATRSPDTFRNVIATALRKGAIEMTNSAASFTNYQARADIPSSYFKENAGCFSDF